MTEPGNDKKAAKAAKREADRAAFKALPTWQKIAWSVAGVAVVVGAVVWFSVANKIPEYAVTSTKDDLVTVEANLSSDGDVRDVVEAVGKPRNRRLTVTIYCPGGRPMIAAGRWDNGVATGGMLNEVRC